MSRVTPVVFLLAALLAGPASAAELRLEITGGYVTLVATDTPLHQILAEWTRVGGTRIVNAERVAGPPVTIVLQRVPEQEALAVLLRSVAGYLAAPRRAGSPGSSMYENVMILATSTPPAGAPPAAAAAARGPVGARPIPQQMDFSQPQMTEGGETGVESEGFITVGSAPAPRQTPATGAAAGAAGQPSSFRQPPFPGARTANPQAAAAAAAAAAARTAPSGAAASPNGVQTRPTVFQPGMLLPNDGSTRVQTNPNSQP